jgi:tetratricopeptide (TPR) repeat protein
MRAATAFVVLLGTGAALPRAGAPQAAAAPSPLVAELRGLATRYHTNPARLDTLREELARAVQTDARAETRLALAEIAFIWGDVRAATREQKLEAYDQGREAARRVVEREPKNTLAHLFFAINTARWGQTNGIVRSITLLPTVKEEIRIMLELDPRRPTIYALAGNVYLEVPRLLGGDLERAEAMFRKGLELDPRFTGNRVGLAKVLVKQGRAAEARRELETVLAEAAPTNPAEWTMKDAKDARALLASL